MNRKGIGHQGDNEALQITRQTLFWQRMVVSVMVSATAQIQRLSLPASLRLGDLLGSIGYALAKKKRLIAERNLDLAFGSQKNAGERDKIVRGVFSHFGRSTVAFLRAPMYTCDELSALVTVEGGEYLEQARQQGKGIILTTGHIGNWEVLGRWLAQIEKLTVTVVAKDPKGPVLAKYLRGMRENAGFAVLSKGESARPLLRVLQRGEAIIILPDQNSGDVFVPFFGVPAGTVAGPASLALHTGATLLPVFCLSNPNGTFRMVFQPPIPTVSTGNREADVTRIMTAFNGVLETMIRQYPDQWLWLHNRWKSVFEEKNRARAWANQQGEYDLALSRWTG
jgi:KDO2-lipid IV(A) lauroyltransferase